MSARKASIIPGGLLFVDSTTSTDDSDATVAVTAGKKWHIYAIHVAYTSTSDVGNRILRIDFRDDSDNVLYSAVAGVNQAASLTYNYSFAPGAPDLTTARGGDTDYISTPIPPTLILDSGYDMRFIDDAAVDADGDDMVIRIFGSEVDKVTTGT